MLTIDPTFQGYVYLEHDPSNDSRFILIITSLIVLPWILEVGSAHIMACYGLFLMQFKQQLAYIVLFKMLQLVMHSQCYTASMSAFLLGFHLKN